MKTNDYRSELRQDVKGKGKTIADLSRATGIPYKRLSGYFCSYWWLNQEEEAKIKTLLLKWSSEQ